MQQQLPQLPDLRAHIVLPLDLARVPEQVRNHRPQVVQHPRLVLELLLYLICLLQDVPVVLAQEAHVLFSAHNLANCVY